MYNSGKPFFITMNNDNIKSLKGYNAFSKVIANGKRIKYNEIVSFFVFKDSELSLLKSSNPYVFYYGVTSSKKVNKKAVIRNRIKRLLRIAIRVIYLKDKDKYNQIKYAIFMYNKSIPYSNYISLTEIIPLVENIMNKAIEFKNKNLSN